MRSVTRSLTGRPWQARWRVSRLAALVGGSLVLAGLVVVAPAGAATPVATAAGAAGVTTAGGSYPIGDPATGYLAELTDPTGSPPGVNVSGCHPAASGPQQYPVILLPGTLYDMADTWQALGPILADDGWCVYGLNYGASVNTTLSGGRIWSVGDIPTSAGQLATFVAQVLAATGASKVDLVGWSQGGMMPRWYLRFDGGAAHVHDLVGLSPSNHGTTVDGTSTGLPRQRFSNDPGYPIEARVSQSPMTKPPSIRTETGTRRQQSVSCLVSAPRRSVQTWFEMVCSSDRGVEGSLISLDRRRLGGLRSARLPAP